MLIVVCLEIIPKLSKKYCYYEHTKKTQMNNPLLQQHPCSDEFYFSKQRAKHFNGKDNNLFTEICREFSSGN